MKEVPMYRTFDGREWEDYQEAVEYSVKKFAEKYNGMTLTEVRYQVQDDETLKEYIQDILYRGSKVTTRYKIEQIPRGLFETADGRLFTDNDAARAHESAIIDEVLAEMTTEELTLTLSGGFPHIYSMLRGAIAKGIGAKAKMADN